MNTISIIASNSAVFESSSANAALTISSAVAACTHSILNPYVYQSGQISVGYQSNYIPSGASGYSLGVSIPASYADDATASALNPSLSVPLKSSVNLGSYLFEIDFTNSFTITMLMPPSSKP